MIPKSCVIRLFNKSHVKFDRIYPALAAKHDILLYPFFLDEVALMVDLNQPDGMHPNQAGLDVIVQKMIPLVKQLINQLDG